MEIPSFYFFVYLLSFIRISKPCQVSQDCQLHEGYKITVSSFCSLLVFAWYSVPLECCPKPVVSGAVKYLRLGRWTHNDDTSTSYNIQRETGEILNSKAKFTWQHCEVRGANEVTVQSVSWIRRFWVLLINSVNPTDLFCNQFAFLQS